MVFDKFIIMEKKSAGIFSSLGAPAQRALANKGISTAKQLSTFTEKEILALHGMGPGSIPRLKKILADAGLGFKKS
jgi:hypothetical protein